MIPAALKRHQHARIVGQDISHHDVGTAHHQFAAFFNPRHRLNLVLYRRQKLADGTETVENAVVGTHYRRTFGCAVSLQHTDTQPLHPDIAGIGLDRFRSAEHKTDIVKIERMCDSAVAAEKGIGTEHNRRADFINDLGHHAVMQGRRIQKQLGSFKQRKQRAHHQTETVEHRQSVKHRVGHVDGFDRRHLLDVGNNVGMAQNHRLRHSFRPRRKQNHSLAVAALFDRHPLDLVTQIGVDLVPQADFFGRLFQINDFDAGLFHHLYGVFHFGGFDKGKRRHHDSHLCGFAHRHHILRADREIEHDGDPVISRQPEKAAQCRNRVGQKQSHMLFRFSPPLQIFAEHEGLDDNIAVRLRLALNVLNELRPSEQAFFGMDFCRFHQLGKKGNVRIVTNFKTHLAQNHINFVADMVALAPQFVLQFKRTRPADDYPHFRQRPVRQFAFGLGKIAVLRPLDPYRNERGARFVRHQPRRFINFHQPAAFGHPSFGKNHAQAPAVHFGDQLLDVARLNRIERHNIGCPHQKADQPVAVQMPV